MREQTNKRYGVGLYFFVVCVTLLLHLTGSIHAFQGPQDSWFLADGWWTGGSETGQFDRVLGMEVGPDGLLYVVDGGDNDRIQVFTQDGTYVTNWGSSGTGEGQFRFDDDFGELAISSAGRVFVADYDNNRIQVFESDGTYVTNWGRYGTEDGQFRGCVSVDIGPDGNVYVADYRGYRIQVFDQDGIFLRKWGSQGTLDGQFQSYLQSVVAGEDGMVYVLDQKSLYSFTTNGTFLTKSQVGDDWSHEDGCFMSWSVDGLLLVNLDGDIIIMEPAGSAVRQWNGNQGGIISLPNGYLLTAGSSYSGNGMVYVYERTYRTAQDAGSEPLPQVLSAAQRAGTFVMDIDYVVHDPDSETVTVALGGFTGGTNSLANFVPVYSAIEGTDIYLGDNVPANQTNRVTWDIAGDLEVDYAHINMGVMANDGRGLLDVGFLTLPADGEEPSLTISVSPVARSELLPIWYWLVASGDTNVVFGTGTVYGVNGSYESVLLAQNNGTTDDGIEFLLSRMGCRMATTGEVQRASLGASGVENEWTPRFTIGPGIRPKAVNEYGFDTGSYWSYPFYLVIE